MCVCMYVFTYFFLKAYLFTLKERSWGEEREREREKKREREKEREPQAGSALSAQSSNAGLELMNCEIMT